MSELSSIDNGMNGMPGRPGPRDVSSSDAARRTPEDARTRDDASARGGPVRRGEDRVEIGAQRPAPADAGRLATAKEQLSMVREDLVRSVRERIESGGYLTDDKLDAAVDRMLSRVERG